MTKKILSRLLASFYMGGCRVALSLIANREAGELQLPFFVLQIAQEKRIIREGQIVLLSIIKNSSLVSVLKKEETCSEMPTMRF